MDIIKNIKNIIYGLLELGLFGGLLCLTAVFPVFFYIINMSTTEFGKFIFNIIKSYYYESWVVSWIVYFLFYVLPILMVGCVGCLFSKTASNFLVNYLRKGVDKK